MKKNTFIFTIIVILALTLTACSAEVTVKPAGSSELPAQSETPAPQPGSPQPAAQEPAWSLDPDSVTDSFVADTLIRLPELALSGLSFTFDSPADLTSPQLYLLFQAWAEPEELRACHAETADVYIFPADAICRTLDRYLEGYSFDIAACPLYDAGRGAVVTEVAGGFGGNVDVTVENKTFDGNTVTLTALLDESMRKTYTITFYDGGYRYLSVRQLDAPQLRPAVGMMRVHGEEHAAFAAVTDDEICLWDAASGGTLLAAARFPLALPGAKDALKSCDFTDLDDDGSSELTAEFSFSDGSTASLIWFYVDGGLVYNEEFSRLPGEPGAA